MLLLEIVLNPEGYWRILSRESTWSKSALKRSHFHQSWEQGTHSSGPSCFKYIYVFINSIMLPMNHRHVRRWEKPAGPKQTTNHQTKPEKWPVGNESQGCPKGKSCFQVWDQKTWESKIKQDHQKEAKGFQFQRIFWLQWKAI